MRLCLSVALSLIMGLSVLAQSYIGFNTDNYAGLHGVLNNPANVSDSRTKIEVNLLGASSFLSNDYASVSFSNLFANADIDFDTADLDASSSNNGILNIDVMGPSAMFEIGHNYSMAVTTRARAFFNVNNLSGRAINLLDSGINEELPIMVDGINATSNAHLWTEYGATFGRVVTKGEKHFLKIGLTAKLLVGYGFVNTNFIRDASLAYDPQATNPDSPVNGNLTLNGEVSYSFSENFDLDNDRELFENRDDYDITSQSRGFGFDLGFVYEYRPDNENLGKKNKNKYRYKIGLSVLDLGSLKYEDSPAAIYNLDNGVLNQETLDRGNFQDIESGLGLNRTGGVRDIKLPASMHLNLDWNAYKNLYLGINTDLSLIKKETAEANRVENSVMLIPRLETQFLSLFLPVGIREFSGFNAGVGFRLGPIYAGSGSLISNAISKKAKGVDFYAGMKIPIFYSRDDKMSSDIDKDGDGVIDSVDLCPDIAGMLVNSGCPKETLIDSDGDGVPDMEDRCPDQFGKRKYRGCPTRVSKLVPFTEEAKELEKTLEDYTTVISFNSGRTSFTEETYEALESILIIINKYPEANFEINGYTDSIGYERANQILSEKRAEVVKAYLVSKGVDASRLKAQGFGEVDPKASNLYAAGRKINRRVEIKVAE